MQIPSHLTESTTTWLHEVEATFSLLPQQERQLVSAAEALDLAEKARARVEADGHFVEDRFGQLRAHPGLAVERGARAAFDRGVRALRLPLFSDKGQRG